jgi:hypothetical protein
MVRYQQITPKLIQPAPLALWEGEMSNTMKLDCREIKGLGGDYVVNPATKECWVVKSSKRGREYLSTITSPPKIKKLVKLAMEEFDRRLTAQLKTELEQAKNKPQSDLISNSETFG